jgi:hypothetical protein
LEGKKDSFKTFFAGIGRTVVADVFETMIAGLLVGPIKQQLLNAGGNAPNAKGGVGGLLSSLITNLFKETGPSRQQQLDREQTDSTALLGSATSAAAAHLDDLSRTAEGTSQAFKGAGFGIVEFLRSLANMPGGGGKGIFGWVSSILGIFSSAAGVFGGGIPDSQTSRGLEPLHVHGGGFITVMGRVRSFDEGGEVFAQLQPGEFVTQRSAVSAIGTAAMGEMNRTGRIPRDNAPIQQTITMQLVDQRSKGLSKSDVVFVIGDDTAKNGPITKSFNNVIKRAK